MSIVTVITYQIKREILFFSAKFSDISKLDEKISADMTYGILTSKSCLLTDIVDQLHESSKKANSVERFSKHLAKGIPHKTLTFYF